MMKILREETFSGSDAEIREKLSSMFRELSKSVKKKKVKKRILFLVDNHNWCWTSTARNIAKHIPEYTFQIESAAEFKAHHKSMIEMCDLIYLRGYPFAFFDGLPKIEKPFIWTLSTGGENLQMRIDQSIGYAKDAKACIVQCKRAQDDAEKAGIKNIYIIPNGVDIEHFKPSNAEKKHVVGFAGNNEGDRAFLKGSEFVKGACEKLGVDYIEVTKKNRLSYDEMPGFYNSIQIYAQPSNSEGCSNSVMEAMACGVPCLICEGVGYHGEVCRESDGVFFVKRTANSISKAINRLLKDKDLYADAVSNAREFAYEHTWPVIAQKHKELIDSVFDGLDKTEIQVVEKSNSNCGACEYFKGLREYGDCGLCMFYPDRLVMKHKNMTCEKQKGKLK